MILAMQDTSGMTSLSWLFNSILTFNSKCLSEGLVMMCLPNGLLFYFDQNLFPLVQINRSFVSYYRLSFFQLFFTCLFPIFPFSSSLIIKRPLACLLVLIVELYSKGSFMLSLWDSPLLYSFRISEVTTEDSRIRGQFKNMTTI